MKNKTNNIKPAKEISMDLSKANFTSLVFKKDELLYKEGVLPKGLYYIENGSIEISKKLDDGKEISLRIAKEGEFIGYKDLIVESRYLSNARAREDSTLYFIKKKDFNDMLKSTDLSQSFLKLTSADFHSLEKDFMDVVSQKSGDNIKSKESNRTNRISLSIDELLNLIGTSVNSFIKILSNLNNQNVLSVKGKMLTMQEDNRLAIIRHIQNQILAKV